MKIDSKSSSPSNRGKYGLILSSIFLLALLGTTTKACTCDLGTEEDLQGKVVNRCIGVICARHNQCASNLCLNEFCADPVTQKNCNDGTN
jgi:hypothetical protein